MEFTREVTCPVCDSDAILELETDEGDESTGTPPGVSVWFTCPHDCQLSDEEKRDLGGREMFLIAREIESQRHHYVTRGD